MGFTRGEHDKATFGNTFRVVLAEDHDALREIDWDPVSADFGFGPDDDVLTMAGFAVAGDPNRANAYALSNDGPHGYYTEKRIDHTPSTDLQCIIGE